MALSTKYQHQPTAIASYSYTDIAEGTGVQKFNLLAGTAAMLSTQTLYSTSIEDYRTTAQAEYAIISTVNYDLIPFNMPKIVGGTALYEVGCWQRNTAGQGEATIIFKVQHWDGSNATELGTAQVFHVPFDGSGSTHKGIKTGTIVLTKKSFKKGDILRLAVEFWGRSTDGGTKQMAMGRDPQNRDGTNITPSSDSNMITKSAVYIPFNLDL